MKREEKNNRYESKRHKNNKAIKKRKKMQKELFCVAFVSREFSASWELSLDLAVMLTEVDCPVCHLGASWEVLCS